MWSTWIRNLAKVSRSWQYFETTGTKRRVDRCHRRWSSVVEVSRYCDREVPYDPQENSRRPERWRVTQRVQLTSLCRRQYHHKSGSWNGLRVRPDCRGEACGSRRHIRPPRRSGLAKLGLIT
ncbi:hypothetical protein RvY_15964-4 [Ramazzottius varieornatus]|uniref:Uncharacterized protein n=1 Tax=Ramazzottius varieornatus TaxID=947166 RepID=A0A1D1W1C7_RAMVA|nr:hypothetical protein RvY_15964-4 [Ramazzottius varieornatus]